MMDRRAPALGPILPTVVCHKKMMVDEKLFLRKWKNCYKSQE